MDRKITIGFDSYLVQLTIKKIKHTYLRVSDDGTVLISSNKKLSNRQITDFIRKNKEKIDSSIEKKVKSHQNKIKVISILGRKYQLEYDYGNKSVITNEKILIKSRTPEDQYKAVDDFVLKHARQILPNIFDEVFGDLNLDLERPALQIRRMKSRWGVCHVTKNKVVLNSELIRYEPEIIRYVIIHELMHFFEPNHSKSYWKLLENYIPNYKEIRQKLK